jgi:hypothetical protein
LITEGETEMMRADEERRLRTSAERVVAEIEKPAMSW